MTGPEHYKRAELWLEQAADYRGDAEAAMIAKAQAHATLALVYATAESKWLYERNAAVTIKDDDL